MHRKTRVIYQAGRGRKVTLGRVVSPSASFDLNGDVNDHDDLLPAAVLSLNNYSFLYMYYL